MNKRAHIRHHVEMPARLILGDEPGRICQVQDFCLGGMLLALPESGLSAQEGLGIDTSVRLALDVQGLRGMRRVVLPARIRRQAGVAVGVAFDHPDSKDLLAVQRHVRALLQKERCGAPPDPAHTSPGSGHDSATHTSPDPAAAPFRRASLYRTAWRLTQRRHAPGHPATEVGSVPRAHREALARALLPVEQGCLMGQSLPTVVEKAAREVNPSLAPALRIPAELVSSLMASLVETRALDEDARKAILGVQVPVFRMLLVEPVLEQPAGAATRLINLMVALGLRGNSAEALAAAKEVAAKYRNEIKALYSIIDKLHEALSGAEALYECRVDSLVSGFRIREQRDRAERWVNGELETRLSGRPIPTVLVTLLKAGWRQMMVEAVRREGEHGPEVRDALDVLDLLAQALERVPTRSELSALLERIKRGLVQIDQRQLSNNRLISSLRDLLSPRVRALAEPETTVLPAGTFDSLARVTRPCADDLTALRRLTETLKRGEWYVLEQNNSRRTLRFAWMNQKQEHFAFTGPTGEDPLELDRPALMQALQNKAIAHVPDQAGSAVARAFDATVERLCKELSHAARHDPLTGLLTPAELERRLIIDGAFRGTLVRIEPGPGPTETTSWDGDAALRHIASYLKEMFYNRLAARADGQGLLLWLAGTGLAAAQTAVEAFRRRVAAGQGESVSLSFGLAERQPLQTVDSLVHEATQACGVAIAQGNGLQVSALPGAGGNALSPCNPDAEARVMLRSRPVEPASKRLQPACCIEVRLAGADGRNAAPPDSSGSSVHYSLMPALDRRVITSLLRWLKTNPHAAARYDHFLLRLSRLSLRDGGFPDFLSEQLQRFSVDAARLCLEFTEVDVAEDMDAARRRMQALRDAGCRLALGDFGLAAMTVGQLRTLPVDILSPDDALVAATRGSEPSSLALIQGINDVARLIGCRTIAPRVPDADTGKRLMRAGLDWVERRPRTEESADIPRRVLTQQ